MMRSTESGKYILQNQLRTWSELKRKQAEEREDQGLKKPSSPPEVPKKRWGGCPDGCEHDQDDYPKRPKRSSAHGHSPLPPPHPTESTKTAATGASTSPNEGNKAQTRPHDAAVPSSILKSRRPASEEDEEAFPRLAKSVKDAQFPLPNRPLKSVPDDRYGLRPNWLEAGRDFGGSKSGVATPADEAGDQEDYGFPMHQRCTSWGSQYHSHKPREDAQATGNLNTKNDDEEKEWIIESGMGAGARADALGDQLDDDDEHSDGVVDQDVPHRADVGVQVSNEEDQDRSFEGSVY